MLMLVILNYLHEVLSRFAAYRSLYKNRAFYVPEGIDKIGGIVLCALAVWVLRRVAWPHGRDRHFSRCMDAVR